MKLAPRCSPSRLGRVWKSVALRVIAASLFVAAVAIVGDAATANVASAQTDWSTPLNVDGSNSFESVSCLSPVFCVAGDDAGDVLTYNGSSWSAPDQIGLVGPLYVSCVTATFCVAVGESGYEYNWNGSSWFDRPQTTNPNLNSVSCASTDFCVAVNDNGGAVTWNGGSWSGPTPIDSSNDLTSVSCPSADFCIAQDNVGNAVTWTGSWGTPTDIDSNALESISCTSSSFCASVDDAGGANIYNYGSGWGGGTIDGSNVLAGVSCAGQFCVAVDSEGNALDFNGSEWSSATSIDTVGLTAVSCPTSSFCIAVDSAGDVVTYIGPGSGLADWSVPLDVDGTNALTSVSCASPQFCVAVDDQGEELTYSDSTWSTPFTIFPQEDPSVSCPSSTFCVAVSGDGRESTFNGSYWNGPITVAGGMTSVSCTSSTFCIAVDNNGGYDTWNGMSWTGPTEIDSGNSFDSVSCTSTTFCVAVDNSGDAYIYNGSGWNGSQIDQTEVEGSNNIVSVSCTSATFCMAYDHGGNSLTYNGSMWAITNIDEAPLAAVSCVTPTFCAGGDTVGEVATYFGSYWSGGDVDANNSFASVSCPTTTFCVATDDVGNVTTYTAPTNLKDWSAPLDVDDSNSLSSVSCASSQFCAAVDSSANAITYNGSSWSSPTGLTEGQNYGVSCAATNFCVAVGSDGAEETWNGSSWGGPSPVGTDNNILNSVSCTSSQFCITVNGNGGYDSWNGTTWTGPDVIDSTNSLSSVSCTSSTFCVAVDFDGQVLSWNGSGWTPPASIDPGNELGSVSCTSNTFCVAVDDVGNAYIYNGTGWSGTNIDGTAPLFSVDCVNTSFCVAGDADGNALTYNGYSWSSVNIDDNVITSISCTSTVFCAATDSAGNVMTYGWVSTTYSCDFSGVGTFSGFTVLLSESPSPPASITAPGTFQTTLSAQITIPEAYINQSVEAHVTSITIGSASVETDALTPTDTPSDSVSPNTLTAPATNLPLTLTPEMNTSYTFGATFNPETWQTVDDPGTVDFTPGEIGITSTYVISGRPSSTTGTCTATSGVTALDTTDVVGPTSTPSFQVPPSVPPIQSQVSPSQDGGWGIEITNTSTLSVTGLSAAIKVNDGGGTLTYDFQGMSKTGTSCSTAGPNQATCSLNTLAAGTSETLNVLVDTTGVVTGTTITGNASVTSTGGAPSQQASLTGLNVVVVPQGVTTVAVPSQPVSSTSKPLSKKLGAKVTLKLPAKVPKMGPFMTWDRDAMPFGATENGPPVSVTLEALAGTQDPELCPPASGGCDGEIVEIEGNFSAYTSSATPISAVVEIYYGKTVPAGKVYFQAATNDTPKVLPACKKTAGSYNTPCLSAATVTGATGKKSAEDTVLFTGGDPLVGRR